ncbi:MAG: amidohydrolase family protein [Rhodospirillaceae bacterium]|nr:amidohydrolase family protein [Rhodospirillaceae bacterium]MDE0617526.1 amidohydrolase family protein [Rhodospirillaceae bacterium]
MGFDIRVSGGTAILPDRGEVRCDIGIRDGRICAILQPGEEDSDTHETIDATGKIVFPGLIDAHLHFGFAEKPDEYASETASAAIGGMATILSYFLNNEPYSDVFKAELPDVEERAHVDFGFHFSTAKEVHLEEFERCVNEYGVTSFKYFMNFRGDAGRYLGLDGTDDGYMYDLLKRAARFPEAVVVMHTENIELVNRFTQRAMAAGKDGLHALAGVKPDFTESENLVRAMVFAEHLGARIYIPHLSCRSGLNEVRAYRQRYPHVYVETCPHYLTHTMDSDLPASVGKANPPLRTQDDVEALWEAIGDGTVDVIGSDHVPRKKQTKMTNIWKSSQGFPGTATILPVLLSEGYHKRSLSLARIAELCGSRPADIFNISARKGRLVVGADADLTIVDLDLEREVRNAELLSYSDYTPYDGWTLKGWPVLTMSRGTTVMRDGKIVGLPGHGIYLSRPYS